MRSPIPAARALIAALVLVLSLAFLTGLSFIDKSNIDQISSFATEGIR